MAECKKVHVEHDDLVNKGDVLLVQESPDLEKEIESVHGATARRHGKARLTRLENSIDNEELTEVEKSQKESEVTQLRESINSLQKQLDLLNIKKEMLKIRSPIDGRVVTWNVRGTLGFEPAGESRRESAGNCRSDQGRGSSKC